jgi:hypothetical protein
VFVADTAIAPQDGVAESLGEGDRHIERTLSRGQRKDPALAGHLLDDGLDFSDVARDQSV